MGCRITAIVVDPINEPVSSGCKIYILCGIDSQSSQARERDKYSTMQADDVLRRAARRDTI